MDQEENNYRNVIGLASELHTHINAILSGEGFIDFLTIIFERELGQSKEEMSVIITSKNQEEIRIPLYLKEERDNETIYKPNPTLIKLLAQDNKTPFAEDIIIEVRNKSYEIKNDNYMDLYIRRNNIIEDLIKELIIFKIIGKQPQKKEALINFIVDTYIDTYIERVEKIKIDSNHRYLVRKIKQEINQKAKKLEPVYISFMKKNDINIDTEIKRLEDKIKELDDFSEDNKKNTIYKLKKIAEEIKEQPNISKREIKERIADTLKEGYLYEIKQELKRYLEIRRVQLKSELENEYKNKSINNHELINDIVRNIINGLNNYFNFSIEENMFLLLPNYEEKKFEVYNEIYMVYIKKILEEMVTKGKVKYAEISTRNPGKVPAWPDIKLPIVYFFLFQFPHDYGIDKLIEEYVKTDSRFIGIDFAGAELDVKKEEVTKRLEELFKRLEQKNLERKMKGQSRKKLSVLRIHAAEFIGMNNNALNYLRGIDGLSPKRKELLPEIRIGHGIKLPVDKKDREEYIKLLKEYDVTIEINPSSNYLLKNISGYHELAKVIHFYLSNGINLVISTDGQGVYSTNLKNEFEKIEEIIDKLVRYLVITELVKMNKNREENNKWTPEEIKEAADMIVKEMTGDIVFSNNDKAYHLSNNENKLKRILAFQKSIYYIYQNSFDDIEDIKEKEAIKEKIGKKNDNIDSINYKFPKEETGKSENANGEKSKLNGAYLAWWKSKNIEKGLSEQEKALAEAMNSLLEESNENNDSSNKGKKH